MLFTLLKRVCIIHSGKKKHSNNIYCNMYMKIICNILIDIKMVITARALLIYRCVYLLTSSEQLYVSVFFFFSMNYLIKIAIQRVIKKKLIFFCLNTFEKQEVARANISFIKKSKRVAHTLI